MIGAGSATLHSDHIIHKAIASMMKPENAENATFNKPRWSVRSHGTGTGGAA